MTDSIEPRYFIIHKPYNMVSQFVSPDKVRLLVDLSFDFPEGTHAIGRLDSNSEGLLILTTNKRVTKLLFESKQAHERKYLIQVRNVMSAERLEQLKNGVYISTRGGADYFAKPVDVAIVDRPAGIEELQENYWSGIPQTWIEMTLTEGKFHQVRKMVQAVGHPCKRLIRLSIEDIRLGDMKSGTVQELTEETFFRMLKIDYKP